MENNESLKRKYTYFKTLAELFNNVSIDLSKLPTPIGDSERKLVSIIETIENSSAQGKAYPKIYSSVANVISSFAESILKYPEILKASRKERIAKGSGRSVMEVNRLLNQFEQSKKMMKAFTNGNMKLPF